MDETNKKHFTMHACQLLDFFEIYSAFSNFIKLYWHVGVGKNDFFFIKFDRSFKQQQKNYIENSIDFSLFKALVACTLVTKT